MSIQNQELEIVLGTTEDFVNMVCGSFFGEDIWCHIALTSILFLYFQGPHCRHRHVRRVLCVNYLCGFCPEGKQCKYMQ